MKEANHQSQSDIVISYGILQACPSSVTNPSMVYNNTYAIKIKIKTIQSPLPQSSPQIKKKLALAPGVFEHRIVSIGRESVRDGFMACVTVARSPRLYIVGTTPGVWFPRGRTRSTL